MRPQGPPPGFLQSDPALGAQQPGHYPTQSQLSAQNALNQPGFRPGLAQRQFQLQDQAVARGPTAPPPGVRPLPPGMTAGPRGPPPGLRPPGPPPGVQVRPSAPPSTANHYGPQAAFSQQQAPPISSAIGRLEAHIEQSAHSAQSHAGLMPPPNRAGLQNSYANQVPRPPTIANHQQPPPIPLTTGMSQMSISRAPPMAGPPIITSTHTGPSRRVYPHAYPPQTQPLATPVPSVGADTLNPLGGGGILQAPHTQQPPASRIDPTQIPRPQPPSSSTMFETRVNGLANLPPPATGQYVVKDTGNCSPRFIRSTLNQIPCTSDLLNNSNMPFALMIQPMALLNPLEDPIEVVDFGESGPVRCARCKAYINPFVKFVDQGRKYICNLCNYSNDTPHDYVCNLGPDGRRRDVDERAELSRGSVEFVAPKEYMVREPMPTVLFFLVDVSVNAVSSGATLAACQAIQQVLSDIPDSETTLVGFATFNSNIHFYNLNPRLQQPAMLVVPEVNDVYTPLPSDLVVKLCEVKEALKELVESIPSLFEGTRISDSACVAALQASFLAIKATGGKILLFQSVLPSIGIGSLSSREVDGRNAANVADKDLIKLLQPLDKQLKNMAMEFADFQVCVDIFLTSQGFVDVASLSSFTRTTGGEIYSYFPFNAEFDNAKLSNDLRWNLIRPTALEAVMKVRCSSGLTIDDYIGNFHRRLPTEIYLPCVDCDKSIMVTVKHEDKLQDNSEVSFQAAILYTSSSGQRRVRVHTLSLPTTSVLANLFRAADLDSQFSFLVKNAAWEALAQPLQAVRDLTVQKGVNILFTYRKFCASATSSGQLILPEALKLLPLYTLALNKSAGLRKDAKLDERSYWLSKALILPPSMVVPLVYPRLFAVHTFVATDMDLSSSSVALPDCLGLSSEKLDQSGVFLLENGEDALLWFSKEASPDLVKQLVGFNSVDDISPGPFSLQEFDNPASKKLNLMLNTVRAQRSSFLRLSLLKRGDVSENLFMQFMVEDRNQSGMSYVEFLVYVHRQIQNKMS